MRDALAPRQRRPYAGLNQRRHSCARLLSRIRFSSLPRIFTKNLRHSTRALSRFRNYFTIRPRFAGSSSTEVFSFFQSQEPGVSSRLPSSHDFFFVSAFFSFTLFSSFRTLNRFDIPRSLTPSPSLFFFLPSKTTARSLALCPSFVLPLTAVFCTLAEGAVSCAMLPLWFASGLRARAAERWKNAETTSPRLHAPRTPPDAHH